MKKTVCLLLLLALVAGMAASCGKPGNVASSDVSLPVEPETVSTTGTTVATTTAPQKTTTTTTAPVKTTVTTTTTTTQTVTTTTTQKPFSVRIVEPAYGKTVEPTNDHIAKWMEAAYEKGSSADYCLMMDIYAMRGVQLRWEASEAPIKYVVAVGNTPDLSDAVIHETTADYLLLNDLYINTDYYWQVSAVYAQRTDKTTIFRFHVKADFRTVNIAGVSNTRDMGGFITKDGKTVRQGLAYRGATLDEMTNYGKNTMVNTLGIRTDLDLREGDEIPQESNPLGVRYINLPGARYWDDAQGINSQKYKDSLRDAIRVFADEENYPLYFHCRLGRDRTGTLSFLIHALLGVEGEMLYRDYELSFFSKQGANWTDHDPISNKVDEFDRLYQQVLRYDPDGDLKTAAENFVLSIGVTRQEIDEIRRIMLEE